MDVDSFMQEFGEIDGEKVAKSLKRKQSGKSELSTPLAQETSGKKKRKKENAADSTAPESSENKNRRGHADSLAKLKDKDPQFHKFLQEHDADLLDWDESDAELSDEEARPEAPKAESEAEDGDDGIAGDEEGEESDDADEDDASPDSSKRQKITRLLLKTWGQQLKKEPGRASVLRLVEAFRAAVERAGADVTSPSLHVQDSDTFTDILRICFTSLRETWLGLLVGTSMSRKGRFPDKAAKKAARHRAPLKQYLGDLLLFLSEVQSESVIAATLDQMGHFAPYYAWFPKLSRNFIKETTRMWSRKRLVLRKRALGALKALLTAKSDLLDSVLRQAYLAYVGSAKDSFTELCLLNEEVAYKQAFLYIRQMAIHLRNAIISKKKDMVRPVYNWQYIQCIYLWVKVLSAASNASHLSSLLYPLVQIALGTARLVPSMTFFPLRYHCARALLPCTHATKPDAHFIPLGQLVLEMLNNPGLAKKGKAPVKKKGARLGKAPAALDIDNIIRFRKVSLWSRPRLFS